MTGKVRVAQLEVDGVSFEMPETKGPGFWKSLPYDEHGIVDFDAVSGELFAAMRRSLELLRAQDTHVIGIFNSTVAFKVGDEQQVLDIEQARLIENGGKIDITGSVIWKGKKIALGGKIDRHAGDNSLAGFELNVRDIPVSLGSPPEVSPVINGNRVNPAHFELEASARLSLTGSAADGDRPERLATELAVDGIDMQLGKVEDVRGGIRLNLEHTVGSRKIEIKSSRLQLGGMQAQFNGAFGPEPEAENNTGGPTYRFEVLTTAATSMPSESTDPPLSFATRIAGRYMADQQRIQFANLDVQTETGQLFGRGSMGFGAGSPEMIFLLRIPQMPVADAKHLWPIDVADGAREWVLKNLFGGTLKDSRIDISLAGGRFNGPGLPPPLTGDEIKADFKVFDTRFDVVGELPPVRDADGEISVRGAYTTIKLFERRGLHAKQS